MEFTDINYLAVLVAALASFGIGALWYSPLLFSKAWQKEVGLTDEYMKENTGSKMITVFGLGFLFTVIMVFALAAILNAQVGIMDAMKGMKIGLLAGAMLSSAATGIQYVYQGKSMKLFLIDGTYMTLFMGISGLILGMWH